MAYPLTTLPADEQLYHLDAIGHILENPYDTTNHIIEIYLTPLDNDFFDTCDQNIKSVFHPHNQKRVQISVGEFFGFQVGSLLKRGKIISRPNRIEFTKTVLINEPSTRLVDPSVFLPPEEDSLYQAVTAIVPPELRGLGVHGLGKLVAIKVGADPYAILIPTTELFRFYHCSSSNLNKLLFSSGVTELNRFVNLDKTEFKPASKELRITLRRDFPDEDAIIIGRWLTSEKYYKSAHAMWNHLVKFRRLSNKKYLPIDAEFPFEGETTLSGSGIELPTPEEFSEKRFLFMSLMHCTYRTPFDHLIIDRETPTPDDPENKSEQEEENEPEKILKRINSRRSLLPKNHLEGISNPFSVPSAYFDTKLYRIPSNRFSQIKTSTERSRTYSPHKVVYHDAGIAFPLNQSTSTKTFSEFDSLQVSFVPEENIKKESSANETNRALALPANFDTFLEVCKELKDMGDVRKIKSIVTAAAENSAYSDASEFTVIQTDVNCTWTTVFNRARQYMVKEITTDINTYYLLYLEQIKDNSTKRSEYYAFYLFRDKRNAKLKSSFIQTTLDDLAKRRFACYGSEFSSRGLYVKSIRRASTAKKICKSIIGVMSDKTWQTPAPANPRGTTLF